MSLGPDSNAVNANDQPIVEIGVSLPAGTNLIGKVGIDQTTPGTTNAVASKGQYVSSPSSLSNNDYANLLIGKRNSLVTTTSVRNHGMEQRSFSCTTNLINIGTTETAFFLFRNPSGSGKLAQIFNWLITIQGAGTVRIYSAPTVTSTGTGLTEVNNYFTTSPTAAVVTCFSQPTVSAKGTLLFVERRSSQFSSVAMNLQNYLAVDANFDLLVTIQNDANNTPTAASAQWIEV